MKKQIIIATAALGVILLTACKERHKKEEFKVFSLDIEVQDKCQYLVSNYPLPPLDPEADKWFLQAKALTKIPPLDYKSITTLYRKAGDKGHYKALNNLAILNLTGYYGVEPNEEEAIKIARKMIDIGYVKGYGLMSKIYFDGYGVEVNRQLADEYAAEASRRGGTIAQLWFGKRLIYHYKKPEEGLHLYRCALAQEDWDAALYLARYYKIVRNDYKTSLKYLLKGVENGNKRAVTGLVLFYRTKNFEVQHDCLVKLRKEHNKNPNLKFPDVVEQCQLSPETDAKEIQKYEEEEAKSYAE